MINRVSAGVPQGGEFAVGARPENDDLEVDTPVAAPRSGAKFEVGDPVLFSSAYGKGAPIEMVVIRVGRKYVYVGRTPSDWKPRKIDIETGREDSNYNGGSLYTREEWDTREARAAAVKRLRNLGVTDGSYGTGARGKTFSKASTDQLERMAAILEESAPPEEPEPAK